MKQYLLALAFSLLSSSAFAGIAGIPPRYACPASQWIDELKGDSDPVCTQPASSDLSDASNIPLLDTANVFTANQSSVADGADRTVTVESGGGFTPFLTLYGHNGTVASPSGTSGGDVLGQIDFCGYDTTKQLCTGSMAFEADDDASTDYLPANLHIVANALLVDSGNWITTAPGDFFWTIDTADTSATVSVNASNGFKLQHDGTTGDSFLGGQVLAGFANSSTHSTTTGFQVTAQDASTADFSDFTGLKLVMDQSIGVNVGNIIGIGAYIDIEGTTVSSASGIYVDSITSDAGTITDLAGLRLGAQTVGSTNWQIYSAGTAPSYLNGDLQLDNQADLKFYELDANGSNFQALTAPASLAGDTTLALNIVPATCTGDGNGGALTVNGSNEIVCSADDGGGGSGDNISVNGTAATDADFDDATPSAPANSINVDWQKDTGTPNNISANVPFVANDFDDSSGSLAIDYTNGQAASTSTKGFLTSTDWNTFNGKVSASTLTTEGDIFYRDASAVNRLPRGSNGDCLTSTASTIAWGSCGGSSGGTKCFALYSVDSADDNKFLTAFDTNTAALNIWCNYEGSAPSTAATFAIDVAGTTMTLSGTPTCAGPTTAATAVTCNSNCTMTAKTPVRFSVTNTPNPATDTYMLCISY